MTLTTPPDFNDDGNSDIFWRNSNGALVNWVMNKAASSTRQLNVTLNGAQIKPDASFSIAAISAISMATADADILWRQHQWLHGALDHERFGDSSRARS